MSIIDQIKEKLEKELTPQILNIQNESEKHIGHMGYKAGEITHIKLIIKSDKLAIYTRLKAHRQIHRIIAEEIAKIHAIEIEMLS